MQLCAVLISMLEIAAPIGGPCFVLGVVAWKIKVIYMNKHSIVVRTSVPCRVFPHALTGHISSLPISC